MLTEAGMTYRETSSRLAAWREQIAELRQKMREAQAAVEPEPVQDYKFATPEGTARLSELFGDKRDLFIIHNMGRSCPHCTLWADGFNGIYPHLADRAAFTIASPDPPAVQRSFAASRGWHMPIVSHQGSTFAADMGYRSSTGGWLPGVSVFRLEAERIVRVADTGFEPTDDFCAIWHLFDLLPEGAAGWQPKFAY
jgi:predicted dithiol-disulfide oxidoreductase (DUF899 family)